MEDGRIRDNQISASTSYESILFSHGPENGRLNRRHVQNITSGAWSAGLNDISQWIQVDLMVPTRIIGVKTQGRQHPYSQWVKMFKIQYSKTGMEWIYVQSDHKDIVSLLSLSCVLSVLVSKLFNGTNYS